MPRITLMFVAVGLSFFCLGRVGAVPTDSTPARIPVRAYGFSVVPPVGWRAAIGPKGLPVFVNFPWSKMQAQLRLPKGGATINLVSWDGVLRRKGDDSLAGWSRLDAVTAAPETVSSQVLDVPQSTGISEAVMVSFDEATFSSDDQAQHETNAYWIFRNRKFAAYLSYVVGDPKGADYESVLKRLIFSVRAL